MLFSTTGSVCFMLTKVILQCETPAIRKNINFILQNILDIAIMILAEVATISTHQKQIHYYTSFYTLILQNRLNITIMILMEVTTSLRQRHLLLTAERVYGAERTHLSCLKGGTGDIAEVENFYDLISINEGKRWSFKSLSSCPKQHTWVIYYTIRMV